MSGAAVILLTVGVKQTKIEADNIFLEVPTMFKEAAQSGKKVIIGLVHLHPLLGTPYYKEGDFYVLPGRPLRRTEFPFQDF